MTTETAHDCQPYLDAQGGLVRPQDQDGIGCPVCLPPDGRVHGKDNPMTIHDSTSMLSKEASVELLADMLRQAEEDKTALLEALRKIATADISDGMVRYELKEIARAAIEQHGKGS